MKKFWRPAVLYLLLLLLDCSMSSTPDEDLFQGDIVLTDEQKDAVKYSHQPPSTPLPSDPHAPQRSVVKLEISKWIGGVVPYELSSELSETARSVIRAAMQQYVMDTCITFRQRHALDSDYVFFQPGKGCYSYVGRFGGRQNISIGDNCQQKGIVMHEIFHALGRWHEQSRPDRDMYVRINEENIKQGRADNFNIVDITRTTTQGIPYDYDSIMHYDAYAYSINGNPTIEPVNNSVPLQRLGQRRYFSERDLQHIRALYCQDEAAEWSTWGPWSNCSESCGEGEQERYRVCIGRSDCDGSNVEKRTCHLRDCVTDPKWGPWGAWTGCNKMCGGGQRTRLRMCLNGNSCEGNKQDFEDCNTHHCPPKWSVWSDWSECSQSCKGGMRQRSRDCIGLEECQDIISPAYEYKECNTNVTCGHAAADGDHWSECSKSCGRGIQFKRTNNSTSINRTCNEQPCHNELCLEGLAHIGCYKLSHSSLQFYEGTSLELSDSPDNRSEPIRKCANVALSSGFYYFAVANGMCFGGSNKLKDFVADGESGICLNGLGNYFGGRFMIDVYQIEDSMVFQSSSNAVESCGVDYCSAEVVVCSSESRVTAPEVRTCFLFAFIALYKLLFVQ